MCVCFIVRSIFALKEMSFSRADLLQIRAAHVAPPVALFLAHHPVVEKYDLSATEFLVSGGAPMGKEVEGLVTKRLGVSVKQAYGMTEASPAVNYTEDALHKAVRMWRTHVSTLSENSE